MKKWLVIIGGIFYGMFIVAVVVTMIGCKSFEPVQVEGQPDECNDFYTVMQYYSVQGGDSAFVGTVYEKCLQARKDAKDNKIRELCRELHPEDMEKYSKCIK